MPQKRQTEPLDKEFVSPLEAAQILGMDRRTLYRHLASGKIPALRVGGAHKIPKSFFESYKIKKKQETNL